MAYRDGFRWVLERPEVRAVVQMDADFSHDPADLPRLLAPLMGNADLVLGTRYMRRRRHGRLAVVPQADQPRRHAVRAHRAAAAVPRPDRRLQGVAARAARGDPPARDVRLRLRLPDRDDLVGAPARRQHRAGADRLPRADRGHVEDDRRRSCARRCCSCCACGWGAIARRPAVAGGRSDLRRAAAWLRCAPASASIAPRPAHAADDGRTPSRRMTNCR